MSTSPLTPPPPDPAPLRPDRERLSGGGRGRFALRWAAGAWLVFGVEDVAILDDQLYALEMATGNSDEPPFVAPGTGKVVRQTGPDTAEDVVTGLAFPVKMEVGPDGALYVGYPAFGAANGEGGILRFDLASGEAIAIDDAMPTGAECTA